MSAAAWYVNPGSHTPRIEPNDAEIKRFMAAVDKSGDCWLWQRSRDAKGYGRFKFRGRNHRAHRLSFAMFNGEIPAEVTVDHTCHCASCVNPQHLRLLSRGDNASDANNRRWSGDDDTPF